jgi:hypothetical protein
MTNGLLGGLYPSDQRHVKVSLEVLLRFFSPSYSERVSKDDRPDLSL